MSILASSKNALYYIRSPESETFVHCAWPQFKCSDHKSCPLHHPIGILRTCIHLLRPILVLQTLRDAFTELHLLASPGSAAARTRIGVCALLLRDSTRH